jgi:hypothetical protein
MVLCAVSLLLAQLMGTHFHRHAHVDGAHSGHDHRTTVHLRDADVHAHAALDVGDHHAFDDRASHPDADLEIDPLGAGLTKFFKIWISPALLLFAMLLLLATGPPLRIRPQWLVSRPHPALFVLRPPSNAPPLKLSPVR